MAAKGARAVTCVVCCYNQAPWVGQALSSVLEQTYRDVELLILDDASTDGSPGIIRTWLSASNVDATFLAHDWNRGIVASLNEAIARATGTYVAFLSADDVWLPHKLETQVRMLEQLPQEVALVYSHATLMSRAGRSSGTRYLDQPGYAWFSSGPPPEGDVLDTLLYYGNFIQLQTALARRDALHAVSPGDERLAFEDYELVLKLASRYQVAFQDDSTVFYRVTGGTSAIARFHAVILENEYDIKARYLWRNGHLDERLAAVLADTALTMYQRRTPHHRQYLKDALRHHPSRRLRALRAAAALRIPAGPAETLVGMAQLLLRGGLDRRASNVAAG